MTESDIDSILAINVKGSMLTVRAAVPALALSGRGRIILISSITGAITGDPGSRTTVQQRPRSSGTCAPRRSSCR